MIRKMLLGIVLATVMVGVLAVPASAGPSGEVGVTANCGGYVVVSANYVRRNDPTLAIVGSIQLCKRLHESGKWEYFARIEMYSALPSGHFANAFVYYSSSFSSSREYISCDDNAGHVLPGHTICYSADIIDNEFTWDFQAVGREYRASSSGGWILNATGVTATIH